MPKAIRIHEQGGPEVMKWEDVDLAPPGAGEIRMRHDAIGLDYIDTYHRGGVYKIPLPSGIGSEAAGTVEAVGGGVTDVKPGDRVCYASGTPLQPVGSYSETRNVPAARIVKIPDGITSDTAAATQNTACPATRRHAKRTSMSRRPAAEWIARATHT